ncbi:ATP-binding protein [Streptococcus anginosus]|uniref:nSTAND3 domain-containing NTPase n=1 Tax=Streptococcus anginosus TaxID=1328 RepID=UPI0022E81C30|nr:ATP-binding protein [Streptococcus anginosus]
MSWINKIENAIKELEGGRFQNLGDAYLRKKYHFQNLVSLGSQEGTDKTTKGIPDSYAEENGKYIYIMYGTHKSVLPKLREDIRLVKEKIYKDNIKEAKIGRIICCHTSSNIEIKQKEELEELAKLYKLELIGVNEIANDLTKLEFQFLSKEYLSISESTEQIWNIDDFIKIHDSSKTNAPISNDYIGDISDIVSWITSSENRILLISAKPGAGKTRLAIEICSLLDRSKYNILCIKNNNQSFYQDVKSHLDSDKENIIFIDDVNLTQNYISTLDLLRVPTTNNIKFILTVRDYEKKEVIKNIKCYGYKVIEPSVLEDNDFTKLLNQFSEYDFTHQEIEHINAISKGNPRIAVIAAKISSSHDLTGFNNEVDILKDYYEEILNKNNISNEEQKVLFILSYLKKIRLDSLAKNQELVSLLKITDITEKEFRNGIEKLYERELSNIYKDKIVKIADQSLDDYIVLKFLVSQKISAIDILRELYPINENKVINLFNQFFNFTKKENDVEIISDAVKKYYNERSCKNGQEKFLAQFGMMLPSEALHYTKNSIDNISPEDFTRDNFILEKNKKTTIEDPILAILNIMGQTKYYKKALQLLLKYFAKKPNKISEVYTILEESYGVFTNEGYINYNRAKETITRFSLLDLTQRYNQELVVTILKRYFKVQGERTKANEENFIIEYYTLPDSENLNRYHKSIIELFKKIYDSGYSNIKNYIEEILYDYQFTILNHSDSHQGIIVKEDLKNIKKLFFPNLANLSMVEEKIVYKLYKAEIKRNLSILNDYKTSERQEVYNSLTHRDYPLIRKDGDKLELQKIAKRYADNWDKIFNYANEFKSNSFMNDRNIEFVLFNMFQQLDNDGKITFLDSMFRTNYHFENIIPAKFLEDLEKESMQVVIDLSPVSEKYKWQFAYLTKLEDVKGEDLQLIKNLLVNHSLPKYFTILDFERLVLKDSSLKDLLLQKASNSNFIISDFVREEDIPRLVNLIRENDLKVLYLKKLGNNIDQSCYLFKKLATEDMGFVVEVLKRISELKIERSNASYMLLQTIMDLKDSEEIFLGFLNYTLANDSLYYYNSMLEDILKKNSDILFRALSKTDEEEVAIKLVNLGVEVIEDRIQKRKLFEMIREKGYGKSSFSKIHFTSHSDFWSGSYVPILEQKKEFLKEIKEIFDDDINYVELVIYIDKIIDNFTQQIERELEKEF